MPRRDDISKIMLIGAGPIVIGQACEFDYSGAQACKALREEGYEVVLVNSNPATIMTDPGFADRTYVEPLTEEALTAIIRRERPDALLPTMGGQTALNLAVKLEESGVLKRYQVELIGATADVIRRAEDRGLFKKAMAEIGLKTPRSVIAMRPVTSASDGTPGALIVLFWTASSPASVIRSAAPSGRSKRSLSLASPAAVASLSA